MFILKLNDYQINTNIQLTHCAIIYVIKVYHSDVMMTFVSLSLCTKARTGPQKSPLSHEPEFIS